MYIRLFFSCKIYFLLQTIEPAHPKFYLQRCNTLRQCITVFSILSQLSTLQPPEGTDLFPPSIYGWLTVNEDEPKCDIRATLHVAVTQGAEDW
jgi:hypothetical protein